MRGAQDSDLRCRREGQGMQLNATAEGEGGQGRKAEQKLVSVASKFHDGRHINSTMEPLLIAGDFEAPSPLIKAAAFLASDSISAALMASLPAMDWQLEALQQCVFSREGSNSFNAVSCVSTSSQQECTELAYQNMARGLFCKQGWGENRQPYRISTAVKDTSR